MKKLGILFFGLSVVILAVYLDRVTAALGTPREYPTSLLNLILFRRDQRRRALAKEAIGTQHS